MTIRTQATPKRAQAALLPSLISLSAIAFSALPARADFELVSSNLTLNQTTGMVDFNLTFNQPPQFDQLAPDGNPVNSFQIDFAGNPVLGSSPASQSNLTAVIRGDEIHIGNDVRARAVNGNGGIDSGGWGPVTAAVPYTLASQNMTFAIPAKDLGYTGGAYSASIYSLADGSLTSDQNVTLVPTPDAAVAGAVGLALVAGIVAISKRRARRA
jgi:hypothetical protein